jgi:hypothetical protein
MNNVNKEILSEIKNLSYLLEQIRQDFAKMREQKIVSISAPECDTDNLVNKDADIREFSLRTVGH